MVCDDCGTPDGRSRFKTVRSFLKHIAQHMKDECFFPYEGPRICALCPGNRTHASFTSLQKHVYQNHKQRRDIEDLLEQADPTTIYETPSVNETDDWFANFMTNELTDFDFESPEHPDMPDSEKVENTHCQAFSGILFQQILDHAIQLESNPSMNRTNANTAISSLIDAVESVCKNLAHVVGSVNNNDDAIRLAAQIEQIPEQLSTLKTEHKRHSYYEINQYLIKPVTRILDEQPVTRNNHGNGITGYKSHSIETVSITSLIALLCASKEFCSQFFWPSDFADSTELRHPFSGSRARQLREKLNDDFIAIEEYGDEFETCNPLGAKKGKHKVMGKYFRFLNLGAHVSSKLMQIFMYLIGGATDFKQYRDVAMLWTLDELKQLEEQGVMAYDKNGIYRRIPVVMFSSNGDNLYSNESNGFQMSFSNGRPCRACPLTYEELTHLASIRDTDLRTVESYDAAMLPSAIAQDTGIFRRCMLNELKHFHCIEALLFDPMHDLAHGHGPWFLKRVLKSVIVDNNILSIPELNTLIAEFPFHGHAQATKPTPLCVTLFAQRQTVATPPRVGTKRRHIEQQIDGFEIEVDNGRVISQSASQMITLLTFLPLIMRRFSTKLENVLEWKEFLKFQRILDIIFSHALNQSDVDELQTLIESHLSFCIRRWKKVLPKAHFLLHYPQVMRQMGPLRHYWCFSYEAKHQTFKRYADTNFCYKNISKSLAYKNQLLLVPLLKLVKDEKFAEHYSEVSIHKKLYLDGTKVAFRCDGSVSVGTVESVCFQDELTLLNLINVKSVHFDARIHCFVYDGQPSTSTANVLQKDLINPMPIELYNGKHFRLIGAYSI